MFQDENTPAKDIHSTWRGKVQLPNRAELLSRLRAAGLPLAESIGSVEVGESEGSKITALISLAGEVPSAILAIPNGFVYRIEPLEFDREWWEFAAKYYYVVTGNMDDRKELARITKADLVDIKGRLAVRKKTEGLSGLGLDEILESIAPIASQSGLFVSES